MMQDRLIVLINLNAKSARTKNRDFGEKTGMKKETVRALADGRQKFNEEYINAITAAFPQYKMWFVFNEVMPEAGQVSPELDEIVENYEETGMDTQ